MNSLRTSAPGGKPGGRDELTVDFGGRRDVSRLQSGIVFVVVGLALNAVGRLFVGRSHSLDGTADVLIIMFASVVLVLFGVYRIVTGRRGG
jgi:hypothetical protein